MEDLVGRKVKAIAHYTGGLSPMKEYIAAGEDGEIVLVHNQGVEILWENGIRESYDLPQHTGCYKLVELNLIDEWADEFEIEL